MVAVVEHGNVPAAGRLGEEFKQGAGALGELEAINDLIVYQIAAPADHVAHMQLGQFVVHQVEHRITVITQFSQQLVHLADVADGCADKHMCLLTAGQTIVKFGDIAVAQHAAELQKGAGLLGNSDGKQCLAFLTHFGAFGDMTQAVEIHVCAAVDAGQHLAPDALAFHILFHAGHAKCARRLNNGAVVVEHILDGSADFVGIHQNDFIDVFAYQIEGVLTHLFYGHAIGKDADLREYDTFSSFDGIVHGCRIHRFHTDDFRVR